MLGRWSIAWILVLALLAGPALALGLGQIQVRSQYGEPFLAEIPIVSSDPAELQQLQARLASPETFARIGLEPPQGVVSDLQFTVALDASGRPVIRVTSAAPVQEALLTFLLEVDWGQGRLVREYSALVDAPDTVAAPAQPPIRAPDAAPTGTIVRPPEPAAASEAGIAGADTPEAAEPASDAGVPAPPVPQPAARPAAATAMSVPGQYGPVQAGDTLSQIVQRIARDDDVTQNQMMLALLRANPEAFIGNNINLVRQGAVLRIPPRDEAARLSAAEATAEVRAQVARWREMSAPAPQPDTALAGETDAAAPDAAAAGAQAAGARLEIVPPSAGGGQQAGTRSGITAGGEGEMLRQEMQETREALIARDAEVEELKTRLAELEQLQRQQQQLITLKDSELAAAQQRLAESNQRPAPTLAQAGTPPADGGLVTGLWLGGGLALLLAALAAWLWSRRAQAQPARSFRPGAAAMPAVPASTAKAPRKRSPAKPTPTWHAGDASAPPNGPVSTPPAASPQGPGFDYGPVPSADTPPATQASEPETPPPEEGLASGQERIELALAYIDLGDVETARSLLQEVADGGSGSEREEAARQLRKLESDAGQDTAGTGT